MFHSASENLLEVLPSPGSIKLSGYFRAPSGSSFPVSGAVQGCPYSVHALSAP